MKGREVVVNEVCIVMIQNFWTHIAQMSPGSDCVGLKKKRVRVSAFTGDSTTFNTVQSKD